MQEVADDIVEVIRRHGGSATSAQIGRDLRLSRRTLYRRLAELTRREAIHKHGLGRYFEGYESGRLPLKGSGPRIMRLIMRQEADAHLSGFDMLVRYAHQFSYETPQLVCCTPAQADGLATALVQARFVVAPAGPGALRGPIAPNTVLMRKQPVIAQETLVQGALATPEKAWVDLLREIRRSGMPIDLEEMGRILRTLLESDGNTRTLRAYARRLGYADWVDAAQGRVSSTLPEHHQLAAGYEAA